MLFHLLKDKNKTEMKKNSQPLARTAFDISDKNYNYDFKRQTGAALQTMHRAWATLNSDNH